MCTKKFLPQMDMTEALALCGMHLAGVELAWRSEAHGSCQEFQVGPWGWVQRALSAVLSQDNHEVSVAPQIPHLQCTNPYYAAGPVSSIRNTELDKQCFLSSFNSDNPIHFILFFMTLSEDLEFLRILSGLLSDGKILLNITEQFIITVKATVIESEKWLW